MNDPLNLLSVPLITTLVYCSIFVLKQFFDEKERFMRLIPSIAIVLGAVFGVIAFYTANDIMPSTDPLTALLIGGASGLAATGSHQLLKQLKSKNSKDEDGLDVNDDSDVDDKDEHA